MRKNMYFWPRDRCLAPISVKICMMVELCHVHGFLHLGGDIFRGSPNRGQNVFLVLFLMQLW